MKTEFKDLQNGVVLAELGGHGNGPYCGEYGAGAALVLLGSYIVDDSDDVPYPADFVFKPGRANYADYLAQNVQAARASGAKVGVSVATVDLKDTVDFLQAAEEAGADYISLCAYSVMEMFTSRGLGSEIVRSQNQDKLEMWVSEILENTTVPLIFKFGFFDIPETNDAVDILSEMGVPIMHAVGDAESGSVGLRNIEKLTGRCKFLIGGGNVTDVDSARNILSAGADAVAVASAAMEDPTLLGRLQSQLRE